LGNKGYWAEANFEAVIQNVFTGDEPLRYSEVWRRCRERGVGSKETLAKYLKRLERTGVLIHDDRGYRRNPLANYPPLNELAQSLNRSVPRARKGWQYSYFTPPGPPSMSERELLATVQREFNMAFRVYAWMLTRLVQTNNRSAAQELVGIFLRTQINPILDELAKNIWLTRKTAPIEALKTRKLVMAP
jgi:hypothetical protein